MVGRFLGHYKIIGQIGQGGMGVVYKAHDTHLDRFVCLKVLPADKVADLKRKLRFVQEAKSASALHHPNIIIVHDIANDNGVDYIAMEYVAGETVQQRLGGKRLPLREALSIAVQVADALARAHAAGIIHRDLKPANIMVDDAGLVKLLDFGLAKLIEDPSSGSATNTIADRLTSEGAVMGTVAYMSPEQAEGEPLDTRSDVFSFGLVLYEMITGQAAFHGGSSASILASILHDEPRRITDIVKGIPPEVERIVARCIRKDPARRFQHMDDVKVALQEIKDEHESGRLTTAAVPAAAKKRTAVWAYIAGLAAVLGVIGLSLWSLYPKTRQPSVTGPVLTRLTSDPGLSFQPSLSPDGKLIAYTSDRAGDGGLDIWVQQLAGGEPIRLTHDPADDQDPSFSPDGARIVFSSAREGGGVYVTSALGGAEQKLAEGGSGPRFSPDGNWIAYHTGDRRIGLARGAVYVIPAGGGVPRRIGDKLADAATPVWSPDAKSLLIVGTRGLPTPAVDWWIVRWDSGEMRKTGILDELRSRKLAPSEFNFATAHLTAFPNSWMGKYIYFSTFYGQISNIWRLPFSAASQTVSGPPERLTAGTALEADGSVFQDGARTSLAFSSIVENMDLWSLPILPDQARPTGELQRLTKGLGADVRPSVSLDGSKLVYNSNPAGNWGIWIKDLRNGSERVLASTEANEQGPRISSDGREVLYLVGSDVFSMPATGGLKRKVASGCSSLSPWSTLGDSFLCQKPTGGLDLVEASSGKRTLIMEGTTAAPRLSWDDRWLTFYRSLSGGLTQVFVAPVMKDRPAKNEDLIPITDGKTWDALPEFSPDGRIVYFQSERDGSRCLWAQRLDSITKKPVGAPFPVQHFHKAGLSLMNVPPGQRAITVARDKIIIVAAERTGNVWLARFE